MSGFSVRDGHLDVVIVAGPRVSPWPSAGVRAISALCAEMGLSVGWVGGDDLLARGVMPSPGTGGLVIAEDPQHRIHRIQGRAVIRVSQDAGMPDPFPGWRSQGLIPLSSAQRLVRESKVSWGPVTVVLGTSNRALRFASELLDRGAHGGASEVYCVETHAQWGAKRYAGWEVERRRFEMLGGRMIEARPVGLQPKGALSWQLRLEDSQGIRILDVARVVSAGPFRDSPGVREYPPGSFLFELEQTAALTRAEDYDGWVLEEERGRLLATKIIRALVSELGSRREELDRVQRRAKARLRRYSRHREQPFQPAYQGKWTSGATSREIRAFSGVPSKLIAEKPVASVECIEEVSCNLCEKACPEGAIQWGREDGLPILDEKACTACGLCLPVCPSNATLLIREQENRSTSLLTLSWRGSRPWKLGEFATLVNRRGETLGSGRIIRLPECATPGVQLVELEVPAHLLWEARALKRGRTQMQAAMDEQEYADAMLSQSGASTVEVTLNGEKRLVRDRVPVSIALFEVGRARAEDVLFCPDGSCGLCQVQVDGVKKLACRTQVRRGMAIKVHSPGEPDSLCPCKGVTRDQVVERLQQGSLSSPEAVVSTCAVGQGKCHGQLCGESFRRLLISEGVDASNWIDWRFPWSDWVLVPT